MPQRDPNLLLPPLINICEKNGKIFLFLFLCCRMGYFFNLKRYDHWSGLPFHHAMFVPGISSYTRVIADVPTTADSGSSDDKVDLSWQYSIQKVWDSLTRSQNEGNNLKEFPNQWWRCLEYALA